jgi:hypothetical protein
MATAEEPIAAAADIHHAPHDELESPVTPADDRTEIADRDDDAPRKPYWMRAALALVVVLVAVASFALLGIHRGGESGREPIAAPAAAPSAATQANAQAAEDQSARTDNSNNIASSSDAAVANEPPQPKVAPSPPSSAASKSRASMAIPAAETIVNEPAGPLLYIVVGSDAQRPYAERLAGPLAQRGIRLGGIRVAAGPPSSDLRYFHSADRAEAATINRALDVIGRPAQRVRYVPGFEGQERNQYELWLPAP